MPTTAWALFLVRERLAAGKTQDEVFDAVREQLDWGPTSRSAYINLEHGPQQGGREPSADEQRILSALYGGRTPEAITPPRPVVDPLERIAAAVENIAHSLELLRTDMAGQSGSTIGAVQHLGAQLTATLAEMRAER